MNKFFILFFGLGCIFLFLREDKYDTLMITSTLEAAGADEIDMKVTRPIEKILFQTGEIENIRSESLYEKSVIFVEIKRKIFQNPQYIKDKIRRKTEVVRDFIPNKTKIVFDDDIDDVFPCFIAIAGDDIPYETLFDKAEKIKNEFLKLKTTKRAEIKGIQKEVLYFYFDNSYFSNLKLTQEFIKKAIKNLNAAFGGGRISNNTEDIELVSNSEFKTPDDIKKRLINLNENPRNISSIFKIEKTIKTPLDSLIKINGKRGLIIALSKKEGASFYSFKKEVNNTFKKLKENSRPDCVLEIFYPFERKTAFIKAELTGGANFKNTEDKIDKIEYFFNSRKNLNHISFIGLYPPKYEKDFVLGADRSDFAIIALDTKDKKIISELKNFINKNIPDIKPEVENLVKIRVLAETKKEISYIKNLLKEKTVSNDIGSLRLNYKIKVNDNQASYTGIDPVMVFDALNSYFNGKVLTYYYRRDIKIPVVLKGENENLCDINSLSIYSSLKNGIIPLGQLAEVEKDYSYSRISRYNNLYSIVFEVRKNDKKEVEKILNQTKGIKYEILKTKF